MNAIILNELFVNETKPSFFPRDHSDEVSFVRFSNNGKLLATCSKDDCIHIYNVLPHGLQLNLRIKTDSMDPGFITFSPADSMMICCSSVEQQSNLLLIRLKEKASSIEDTKASDNPNNIESPRKLSHELLLALDSGISKKTFAFASFSPTGKHFVTGGIGGRFEYYSINSKEPLAHWAGVRVRGCSWLSDNRILVADNQNRVQLYHFKKIIDSRLSLSEGVENNGPEFLFKEEENILSMRCFKHKFNNRPICFLSVKCRGIRLWDINSRSMVRSFSGLHQINMIYDIALGGNESQFIAAGSEDKKISIWHINMELPVKVLEGHHGAVNSVDWFGNFMVSVSDDFSLRLWAP